MPDENKNSVLPDSDAPTENDARLNLLYEIGRILASLETMNEAAPQILETICRVLQFELGELWCLGKDETTLRLENVWHLPAAPLEKFAADSRRFRFPVNEGLPGKVWAKNAPVWITDLSGEGDMPRRFFIEETNLRSAFAFPILLGERLLGVFSFFSRQSRQPDEALLQMFAAVGSHIGQFIKREKIESNLRESEDRYRAFITQSTEGIWRFELDEKFSANLPIDEQVKLAFERGYLAECNDAMARMYGLEKAADLVGSRIADLLDMSDAANVEYLRSFIESGYNLIDAESHEKDADGSDKYFLNSLIGTIEDGNLVRVWGTQRDITEQKRHAQVMRESEESYRIVAETASDAVIKIDEDSRILFVNSAVERIFGYAVGEMLGQSLTMIMPEELRAGHRAGIRRYLETGERRLSWESMEIPALHAKGHTFPLEISFGEYSEHGKRFFIGIARDITDRKQAEKRLTLLAEISEMTRVFEDPNEFLFAVSKVVGEHLQVRRCLFNEIDFERDLETIHGDYCRGVESVAGVHRISDYSSITSAEMMAGKTVVNRDSKTDSRTVPDYAKTYAPVGERAYVAVPLMRENRWVASLWVSDDEPRDWSAAEISLLETTAERAWLTIEKLRNEDALRESKERFAKAFNSSPLAISITSLDTGKLVEVNETFVNLTGYSREEAIGRTTEELGLWEKSRDRAAELSAVKSNGQVRNREYVFRTRNGGEIVGLLSAELLELGGEPCALTVIQDITDRKKSEKRVAESEEKFRNLANSISQFAWMTDADGYIFWYNDRWFDYTGTTLEEMQGWGWQAVHHPDYVAPVTEKFKRHIASGEIWEDTFPLRSKTGEFRWFLSRALPIRDEINQIVRWFGTNTDITERKEAEQMLLERERLALLNSDVNRALIQNNTLPDILKACTAAVVKHLDAAFARVWTLDEKKNVLELQASSGIYTHLDGEHSRVPLGKFKIGTIAAERQPHLTNSVVGDVRVGNQEWAKREKMVAFAGYPLLVEDRLVGVVAMFARQPLTEKTVEALAAVSNAIALGIERKHTESERERLLVSEQQAREVAEDANHSKDEFIALVSHELRSPLNAMLGWTRILQEQKPDEKTKEYALDVIVRNARSQSRLIEDLLDIARVGKGKLRLELQPTELIPIINAAIEIIKPTAEAGNIKLSQTLDRAADFITGDVDRLRQVLENLLSNAVKFTTPGGSVRISLERDKRDAKIIISDTGQGISREFLPQIFERFKQADPSTTRRHGGLGIGLSLARDLVELHGGAISAESAGEGEGATFTVTLPVRMVAPIKENSDKVEFMDAQGKLSGFWILAVDDEADARELVSFMLQINGAKVTTANSAVEALDILKNTDGRLPDILLSDISMPNESGYALLEKIRALPSEHGGLIPAVALTAFNRLEDREAAFDAGFQKHLGKPVEPDELISAIIETARAK